MDIGLKLITWHTVWVFTYLWSCCVLYITIEKESILDAHKIINIYFNIFLKSLKYIKTCFQAGYKDIGYKAVQQSYQLMK